MGPAVAHDAMKGDEGFGGVGGLKGFLAHPFFPPVGVWFRMAGRGGTTAPMVGGGVGPPGEDVGLDVGEPRVSKDVTQPAFQFTRGDLVEVPFLVGVDANLLLHVFKDGVVGPSTGQHNELEKELLVCNSDPCLPHLERKFLEAAVEGLDRFALLVFDMSPLLAPLPQPPDPGGLVMTNKEAVEFASLFIFQVTVALPLEEEVPLDLFGAVEPATEKVSGKRVRDQCISSCGGGVVEDVLSLTRPWRTHHIGLDLEEPIREFPRFLGNREPLVFGDVVNRILADRGVGLFLGVLESSAATTSDAAGRAGGEGCGYRGSVELGDAIREIPLDEPWIAETCGGLAIRNDVDFAGDIHLTAVRVVKAMKTCPSVGVEFPELPELPVDVERERGTETLVRIRSHRSELLAPKLFVESLGSADAGATGRRGILAADYPDTRVVPCPILEVGPEGPGESVCVDDLRTAPGDRYSIDVVSRREGAINPPMKPVEVWVKNRKVAAARPADENREDLFNSVVQVEPETEDLSCFGAGANEDKP